MDGHETQNGKRVSTLGLVKDVLGIGVILGGFLSSIVVGAIWIDDLSEKVIALERNMETNAALITAHEDALKTYGAKAQSTDAKSVPSLKEQQCVSLSQQRRSARGKTADAVQAAMNALGCTKISN